MRITFSVISCYSIVMSIRQGIPKTFPRTLGEISEGLGRSGRNRAKTKRSAQDGFWQGSQPSPGQAS